ncbi:GntR family transcriptional regulator [Bordetella sp. 02P26C-1]|uniref:GntR family transcriptional regulator n=1 Tax=Bordetella sp. 02P26C-1 TaxID=2683195 RepID=UPI001355FEED|nr:GntR family transcriptional regulator [Bordetella sp. 02P26C-1]MVW77690.1 FCD domain-containing protein [Bordetella sp. 02P26C-1]
MNESDTATPSLASNETLSDRVYEMMVDAIIRGEFAPGSRLIEMELAERFAVSRGPLREAMRHLADRRLIMRTARQGARVSELSAQVWEEISTVRELLESAACRLAAENMSDEEIEQLVDIVEGDAKLVASGRAYYRREDVLDVHFRIVRGARNSIIEDILGRNLYPLIRMYRYQHKLVEGRAERALKEHRAIIEAISQRDGELAQLLMKRHLATSRHLVLEAISSEVATAQ